MRWGRRIGVIYHSAQPMNDSITSAGVIVLILKKKQCETLPSAQHKRCYFFRLIKQQMSPLFHLNSWNVYIGVTLINLT